MILPSGTRKEQIAQGPDSCQHHLDMFAAISGDILKKLSAIGDTPEIGGESGLADPELTQHLNRAFQPKPPALNPGVDDNSAMPSSKSIAPAGGISGNQQGTGGGALAAQPIAPDGDQGNNPNTKNQAFMEQAGQIAQFVKQNNMDVNSHSTVDDKGTYKLEIAPIDGYAMPNVDYSVKVQNIVRLLDSMGAEIRGTSKGKGQGGSSTWTITYSYNPNPKIMKGKGR